MSDILAIPQGETWRAAGMVKKADGDPITAGTVNYYLRCLTGMNAGNYWRDSDQTWQAAKTANAMTHQGDGLWTINLTDSPFTFDNRYVEWAEESTGIHTPAEGRILRAQYILENSRVENLDNAISTDGHVFTDVQKVLGLTPTPLTEPLKVDVDTVKEQAITCDQAITIHEVLGQDHKIGTNASGHISRVVLVDTTTENSDMRGTNNAALAVTALSNVVWTDARAGFIDVAISSRSDYDGSDTAGTTTLLERVVGTLAAGTHQPSSGDTFAVVNHVTHGNAAILARGDIAWLTGNTVEPDPVGTAATTAAALVLHGDSNWATATGFAQPGDVTEARDAIIARGDLAWTTGNTTTPPTAGAIATQVRTELATELGYVAGLNTRLTVEWAERVACLVIGNVTEARTANEQFVYGGVTATVNGDEDGNRTIVFS
jgi:hypothetical protein